MTLAELRPTLRDLADRGVFLGTSSWKYPGWLGQLYEEQRYLTRGRFSTARFERECLAEYAETFPSVCVDASFYRFPGAKFLAGIHDQVPDGFRFSHKVTDTVTTRRFPKLPRHGEYAGEPNPVFLEPGVLLESFLRPLEPYRDKTGLLIFEFTRFRKGDFENGREFLQLLDRFLGALPTREWDFGIELRNPSLLRDEYFDLIDRHHVGHVYNHWQRMPPSGDQLDQRPVDRLQAACGMRLLLKPGRAYQEAVDSFQPYDRLREPRPEARKAALRMLRDSLKKKPKRKGYLYVNNRLEGNSLATISAILTSFIGSK